jgi:23S rRNA (guanosine2251-2'-O)-methyltransferase
VVLAAGATGKGLDEIRGLTSRLGVELVEVSREAFLRIAPLEKSQGAVAYARQPRFLDIGELLNASSSRGEPGFLLFLDQLEDPQNVGALIRTAECAGVHGVVLPKHHSAAVSHGTLKASAGAVAHVPIAEVTNLVSAIRDLKKERYWVVGLDAAGERLYTDVDYTTPVILVVGSEGKGMRRLVRAECDFLVRIPLYGRISSLNASVAGALVMYEVARQRKGHIRAARPS